MRKATIIIATLFASLGAWQMIASAGTRTVSPTTATTTDVTFTEGLCSDAGAHCKVVGDKSDPLAFGNRLIFTIPLSSGGTRIGYEQGDCVYLQKTSKSDYCTYNLHLPNGSVSVQGTLPYISENSQMSGRVPITGGTRGYLGAYGTIQLIAGTFDYQLHIVTP